MKISHEKEFQTRDELDSFVRSQYGEDNKGVEIELSENEAKKLMLSEKSKVYGAKIKVAKTTDVDKV